MIAKQRLWVVLPAAVTGLAVVALNLVTGHRVLALVGIAALPVFVAWLAWSGSRPMIALVDDRDERARSVAIDALLPTFLVTLAVVVVAGLFEVARGAVGPFRLLALLMGATYTAAYLVNYRRR